MAEEVAPSRSASAPILLVRLGAIGDVVRALPALDLLRREHPEVPVDWLVEETSAPLLEGHPQLRRRIVFPRREVARRASRLRLASASALLSATGRALQDGGYGAVVDLQGSFKSAWLARLSRCPLRIGLASGHGREASHLLYTRTVDPGPGRMSRVERNFRLLAPLGVAPSGDAPAPRALLPLTEPDRAWAAGVLASLAPGSPRVLLYPGTSQRQAYKRWPAARYGWLAARLGDDGAAVLVAGGPGEEEIVRSACEATSRPPARVPPSSLRQLAAVLEGIDLFVGGDTGPMHLAWAAGTRVLGLFGATDPVVNAPYDPRGLGHRVLYRGPAERSYRVTGAPARAWMEAITVDEAHAACREMLGLGRA
jgi:heptosyltransferase-1